MGKLGKPIPHGTLSGFQYHKCRCDMCVEFNRAYYASHRAKNKQKNAEYHREWHELNRNRRREKRTDLRNQKRDFLQQVKLEKGCADCGYKEHVEALDFDHLDPSNKLFDIGSQGTNKSWILLVAEIEKCEVVCANCHRARNVEQRKERGLRR